MTAIFGYPAKIVIDVRGQQVEVTDFDAYGRMGSRNSPGALVLEIPGPGILSAIEAAEKEAACCCKCCCNK
jgi:hypothetical protein